MTIHVVLNHRKSNTTEFFITCSYAFDELVHNSDFFWLLIDVFRQLLEHFALVGMNTKLLTPKQENINLLLMKIVVRSNEQMTL